MLISKAILVKINKSNFKHYQKLGYDMPKKLNNNGKTTNDFSKSIKVDVYDLQPSVVSIRVEVECDYCHKIHTKPWAKFLKGREHIDKDACSSCASKKQQEISMKLYGVSHPTQREEAKLNMGNAKRKHTIEEVSLLFEEAGYKLITKEYTNNEQKLFYTCPKHGIKNISLGHFLTGKRCRDCQYEKNAETQSYSIRDVKSLLEEYDPELEIINIKYKNYKDNSIKIKCKECGDEVIKPLNIILRGKVRCDTCSNSQSSAEFMLEKWLIENYPYYYKKELSFIGCKFKNKLKFDFALFDKNNNVDLLIELDGQQHFYPVKFGGMSQEEANLQFCDNVMRDAIKNSYCEDNNINLLRIPYWDFNKIETILQDIIQKQ